MAKQGLASRWFKRQPRIQQTVRFTRRNLYVLPSKAGFGLLLALVIMLLAAINYQNSMAYALTFTLGSLALVSLLHTWRNLQGLKVEPAGSHNCFPSETAAFRIKLSNPHASNRYAIGIGWHRQHQAAESPTIRWQALQWLDLDANSEQLLQLHWPAKRRGKLSAPSIRIESRYPLGIWQVWSHFQLQHSAWVYPQPIEKAWQADSQGQQTDQLTSESRRSGVDDYEGLRDWQPGESVRRVHWKAWSKGQGLLVKSFTQLEGAQQQLDFAALDGDIEHRLSVLAFQVLQLSEQQQTFALRLPQKTIGSNSGLAHQWACLAALASFGEQDA